MRLRKVKNIEEKIKQFAGIIVFEPQLIKGKWKEEFTNNNPIYLEIGTGKGNFIVQHALKNPDINFIGCEVSNSVIYKAAIKGQKIANLRLINIDASLLKDVFVGEEIAQIYLNFSDPWPKARHEKRRLTSSIFLELYKNILVKQGIIELKSDNQHFFEYSVLKFNEQKWDFLEINLDLHKEVTTEIITTEYEEKFKEIGKTIYYIKVRIN
ncbi:MAG: tRNA (guanosine(46)-N7)-methyltransferase TrmB [Bacilli bacterium]|jgi:tRNA (guanine-N7-)-methyltransferase|nr:tRNA (guanosine(46)-N7)-methyltransferase TrmB [Bacilli bacterium]MDD3348489.1 tRNA (guanosine(46)-N7)-methyltransferase TrmB [Bacilli bacterium]MDD4056779.1 tRNA (guanosine(46)-N7)-methyltransferase TrmB [Bacilli bacterium]MDY0208891.1 tRNA (guanosine(46)-N7)-methyltransferase TrmB [Bacilli bacterium]